MYYPRGSVNMILSLLLLYFPLFTAGKGFWSEMLGVGDFYYELGVQIIEVCLALKHRNGGKGGSAPAFFQ